MIYFLVKVNNYEGTIKAQLEVEDNLSDLVDLSTILDSVAPLYSFSSYLDKHKPDYKFLLKLIKAYRQYQELMAESGENREHANSIASQKDFNLMNDKDGELKLLDRRHLDLTERLDIFSQAITDLYKRNIKAF